MSKYKLFLFLNILCTLLFVCYIFNRKNSNYVERTLRHITKCTDKPQVLKRQRRGDSWVLYNYVTAEKTFRCNESITFTTQADYTFLDNVLEVVRRWRGPVSVALYAPGDDFNSTLLSILYLRECNGSNLVKEYVTFHVFFDTKHLPKEVPPHGQILTLPYDCSIPPPFFNISQKDTYRTKNKLLYPINVARNIARETAQTHYVFASDIELYPSPNIISRFLKMMEDPKALVDKPTIFVLPIFEVAKDQKVPETKEKLVQMVKEKTAVAFHKYVCPGCHRIPKSGEWLEAEETNTLRVFTVAKRTKKFRNWEPFYIGTNAEPFFDERLTWEGKSNKMTQAYIMCVLDYDFAILDNAFLVHKPGIKKRSKGNQLSSAKEAKTKKFIKDVILPEYNVLFGSKKGCAISWELKNN